MKISTEILDDYINNNLENKTKEEVDLWRNINSENEKYFQELKTYSNTAQNLSPSLFDSTEALRKVKIKISEIKRKKKAYTIKRSLVYAASICLLMGLSVTIYFIAEKLSYQTISNNTYSKLEVKLPDNTTVILDKGAQIKYRKKFEAHQRKISLIGSAFFNVSRNEQKPFIINTKRTQTKVLGTSFKITSDANKTNIKVVSGKVIFTQLDNKLNKTVLLKGDSACYNANYHSILSVNKENKEKKIIEYLNYKNKSLENICTELSSIFGIEISIEDKKIKDRKLTAIFENLEITEVINSICFSLNVEASFSNNKISIKNNNTDNI